MVNFCKSSCKLEKNIHSLIWGYMSIKLNLLSAMFKFIVMFCLTLIERCTKTSCHDSKNFSLKFYNFFVLYILSLLQLVHTTFKTVILGASLVAQWLRICLPMQGTRVRALVWEDPTCREATGPVSRNY